MSIRYQSLAGLLLALSVYLVACSDRSNETATSSKTTDPVAPIATTATEPESCARRSETGLPLFGDVHVHTSYSFDAAANSTGATPADANRYARGEAIPFFPIGAAGAPTGSTQIDRPLDFLAVTDHGEFLGERAICRTAGSPRYDTDFCKAYRANERQGMLMLATAITSEEPARIPAVCGDDLALCPEFARLPWQDIQDAANEANEPCRFTSFIAYEYTGTPGTSNYHRNVIFRNEHVPELPVSYIDAPIDSKLWAGLDEVCSSEDGCDYLTIPHNSNLANGRMAPYMQLDQTLENKRAYAMQRQKREPIMEIFQHKGGSECINGLTSVLGAPDELCDVEAVRRIGEDKTYVTRDISSGELVTDNASQTTQECEDGEKGNSGMLGAGCVHPTDYQRSALVVGLREEQDTGLNPIKLGIIAATDTHTATPGGALESAWVGAVTGESTPAERLEPGLLTSGIDGNPGGLAGVWAKQNTRDEIFDAMLRREVFGTSGPRIVPRFFAGWGLAADLCDRADMVEQAYARGVPMGGDLPAGGTGKPTFLATANKDPNGLGLVELNLIKGWVAADGTLHTAVIEIDEAQTPANSLCTVYTDETFDASQPTYYYLRAVEPPSPRWHTYDCERLDADVRPSVCVDGRYPDEVREMAWTSPIWYRPAQVAE